MLAAIDCDHLAGYRTGFKQILGRGGNVLGRGAAAQNRGRLLALEMGFALTRIVPTSSPASVIEAVPV